MNTNSMTHRVLDAVEVFIRQRSKLDSRDYGTQFWQRGPNGTMIPTDELRAYRSEVYQISKDRKLALAALAEAHSVTGEANGIMDTLTLLEESFQRAFSGRLEYRREHAMAMMQTPEHAGYDARFAVPKKDLETWLHYTTGQYFPTEYRKAACAVLETYVSSVRAELAKNSPRAFTYRTIADVRAANKAIGGHWFDRSSMRFFNSVIESKLINGRYFVTSERIDLDHKKLYTVREANSDGDIDIVGEFQGYHTRENAMIAARCASARASKKVTSAA